MTLSRYWTIVNRVSGGTIRRLRRQALTRPLRGSKNEAEQEGADEDAKARVGSLVHRDLLPVTGPGVSLRQTVKCVW